MIKTIKGKAMTRITMTIVFFMSLIFIFINATLENHLKANVNNDMKSIKSTIDDVIKNYYLMGEIKIKENDFKDNGWYILNKLSHRIPYFVSIIETNGSVIGEVDVMLTNLDYKKIQASNNDELKIVDLSYSNNTLVGTLNYPFYLEGNFLGTIVIQKSFTDVFLETKQTMYIILLIMIISLILILSIVYLILKNITTPLSNLSVAMKKVSNGNFSINIENKSQDEISLLAENFMDMKEKIKSQLDDLTAEKEKVEKLSISRKHFFDNVTHELKTPLTGISGYAQILTGDVHDESFKKRASERIVLESNRLHRLVCELLDYSKLQSNIIEDKEIINVNYLIEEIIEDLLIKYKDYDIKVHSYLDNIELYTIKDRLSQIIINLIDNGFKYSKDKHLTIKLFYENGNVILLTENITYELPSNIKNNIFQPFTKYNDQNDYVSSTGLGLYISKEIANKLNFHLRVYFQDNIITFKLVMPRN